MSEVVEIEFTINGNLVHGWCEPRKLLVDFLREDLGLTGTHVGCEHGICGACTLMLDGEAARSCIMFAVQANGRSLTTIEGISADESGKQLQEAFHEHHGLQCGYCTPGMLITALDYLRVNPDPDESEVRHAISAVVCRCTGYQQIVDAVMAGAQKIRETAS